MRYSLHITLAIFLTSSAMASETAGTAPPAVQTTVELLPRLKNILAFAREQASAKMRTLDMGHVPSGTPKDIVDFFTANRSALADDIDSSDYQFVENGQNPLGTCLLTHLSTKAPVLFNVASCKNVYYEDMLRLVVHESIHHLGISDEAFAYAASNIFFEQIQNLSFQNLVLDCQPIYPGYVFSAKVIQDAAKNQRVVVMIKDPSGPLTVGVSAPNAVVYKDHPRARPHVEGSNSESLFYNIFETDGADYLGVLEVEDFVLPDRGNLSFLGGRCHSARCQSLRASPDYPFPAEPDYSIDAELLCKEIKK